MSKSKAAVFIAILIALDYASKWAVENYLPFQAKVDVIPFLAFYRTYNEGIAFSFLSSMNDWVLVAFTIVVIGIVFWLWKQAEPQRILTHIGYALVIGGAVGNLIDRVVLGYVIDFILFHTPVWSFAIFNLADSFITVGAAAIILDEVLDFRRKRGDKTSTEEQ